MFEKRYYRFILNLFIVLIIGVTLALTLLFFFHGDDRDDDKDDVDGKSLQEYVADYRKTVEDSEYIMHALGGMDGEKSYINSIDCLELKYSEGYRLFEADVSFTSDGVLVLAHSGEDNIWTENDWELRLGQEYPLDDSDKHLCTYEEFMGFKIQGEYTATSLAELFEFMKQHTDMYVMIDAGHRSYEDTLEYYRVLVETANGQTDILYRLIAGGQTTEMVRAARECYDFPLINLYYDSDEKREDIISTPEKFVDYCKQENIISFSTAKEYYTEEAAEVLSGEDSGLISYIFTINDITEAELMKTRGADIIGTDFLK